MYLDQLIEQRQSLTEIIAKSADSIAKIDKTMDVIKSQEVEESRGSMSVNLEVKECQ